jgi:tetratricopeptide (TPR) repeat protein
MLRWLRVVADHSPRPECTWTTNDPQLRRLRDQSRPARTQARKASCPCAAIYYGVAAYAQFVGKNYAQAISLSREAIRLRGDFSGAYRVLTVAAGMAGQTEVATAALQELRRAQPNISLAWIANTLPWKREADREHYLEAFRRAGLD